MTLDDNFKRMNPLYGIHKEFKILIDNMIIKYSYMAEESESFESKRNADEYLSALAERDTFFTYRDYTADEIKEAIKQVDYKPHDADLSKRDIEIIARGSIDDGYLTIPERYRDFLLIQRRNQIIENYNELNEYYRILNGLPPLNTYREDYHYLTPHYANLYNVDSNVAIHEIQDVYNKIEDNRGDYIISNLEANGVIQNLIDKFPDEEYLQHIGSKRVSIKHAREAKNFQILYILQKTVKDNLYDEFLKVYEQCRDYFMTVIFVREFRDFIENYDNLIALCIMVMTINTTLNQQFPLGIDREYYNDYTLKMLYEAYGIPYDMKIDQYTQRRICQSLNLLIQRKSTDKVIYDIGEILGFENLEVYKYFLTKERKYDIYGFPVIKYKNKFNNESGKFEMVPDYEAMYDLYFQRAELREHNLLKAYQSSVNKMNYEAITTDDPYWWEDTDLYNTVWETEYNFVESKYLGLAVSYRMSEILYENVILLKMLIDKNDEISSIKITLPKISPSLNVTIFEAIMLLFCLTSYKHHIKGEIIAIPTQVLSVLDYLHNTDGGDEYLVDSFGFDFKLFLPDNLEGQDLINRLKELLGKEDSDAPSKFMGYITNLTINPDLDNSEKIRLINEIYDNIKGLSKYIQYKMAETSNRETYETLKEFYRAVFYAREVKDIFTINGDDETHKRTAKSFFEFMYYQYPSIYNMIFQPDFTKQYTEYVTENDIDTSQYTENDFIEDILMGNYGEDFDIKNFTFANLNTDNENLNINDSLIYYYVEHIIYRLETVINNLKYIYMMNDSSTPLEDLLLKMIRYFKSFTVDCLGLDIIYVYDMRSENTIRFFDEIAKITKWIEAHEHIKLSYSDVLHLIDARYKLDENSILLHDKEIHNKIIEIANHINFIKLRDNAVINSIIKLQDSNENNLKLYDVFNDLSANVITKDKKSESLFKDKITRMWYDD